jgi:hypothetical protein
MSRFTIEFNDEADAGLENIRKQLGVTTKADVIRKAVNLLNYVVEERKDGGKLVIENEAKKVRKEIVTI